MHSLKNQSSNPETDNLIVVSGFGPFAGHEVVNASWEAVKLLPEYVQCNGTNFRIDKKLVSVEYDEVDAAIDEIWSKKPQLVIHCGVHAGSKCIRLETNAYNHKFSRKDYAGRKLCSDSICLRANGNCDKLYTQLDVPEIVKKVSHVCLGKDSVICSDDVGNYLCGYIYLKSLDKDCTRCLFIHVPPISSSTTSQETEETIVKIIIECLLQVNLKSKDLTKS